MRAYRYASRIDKDGVGQGHDRLSDRRAEHDPAADQGQPIAHGWCGCWPCRPDWSAGVNLDPATGLGEAGGYVRHGVTATNLAGRTLTDLVLKRSTELTARRGWGTTQNLGA